MADDRDGVVERIRTAMEAGDVDAFLALCAEGVHWGPPGDSRSGCQNRAQVRSWYQAALGRGVQAAVTDVMAAPAGALVSLSVSPSPAPGEQPGPADRWQVLTVRDGLIVDICGFEDRAEAEQWAGIAS